ncbi:MAG: hypothetical protein O3B41_02545 [Bacteroidetes bacterium]|nr:hypothetical protein [Bacteroidota bacterium]
MTYVNKVAVLLVLAFCLTGTTESWARQDVVLPDLAPREVEITGDLTIVFPALRRQPLVGFNPPPIVPDIPASRLPYAEAYKQPSADLPPSPVLAPDPPEVSAIANRTPMNGMMSASFGRHFDRSLAAEIAMRYTLTSSALFNIEYRGTDGHEPIAGSSANSGFDFLTSSLRLSTGLGPVVLSSAISGFKRSYSLFGLNPVLGSGAVSDPIRDLNGGLLALGISSKPGAKYDARLSFKGGLTTVDTEVYEPTVRVDPATTRDEKFLTTTGKLSIPITDGFIAFSATGSTSGLDSGSFPGSTVQSGYSQALVSYLYSKNLNIKAGVAVMGFRSDPQYAGDRPRSLSYLSPVVELSYTLSSAMRVFGGNQPQLEAGLLKETYTSAPFLKDEPLLLPSLTSIDAHSGIEYLSEFVTTKFQLGYKELPYQRYAFQNPAIQNGYDRGYASLGYEKAQMMYGRVDLGVMLSPGMQFGLDAEYRQAELSDLKVDIPYFSPFSFGGFASVSFLEGDALAQLNFRHEAARPIDVTGIQKTGGITLVGIEGSYYLTSAYGLTAGVKNIGASPEFWHLYPLESTTFFVGAKYRW